MFKKMCRKLWIAAWSLISFSGHPPSLTPAQNPVDPGARLQAGNWDVSLEKLTPSRTFQNKQPALSKAVCQLWKAHAKQAQEGALRGPQEAMSKQHLQAQASHWNQQTNQQDGAKESSRSYYRANSANLPTTKQCKPLKGIFFPWLNGQFSPVIAPGVLVNSALAKDSTDRKKEKWEFSTWQAHLRLEGLRCLCLPMHIFTILLYFKTLEWCLNTQICFK